MGYVIVWHRSHIASCGLCASNAVRFVGGMQHSVLVFDQRIYSRNASEKLARENVDAVSVQEAADTYTKHESTSLERTYLIPKLCLTYLKGMDLLNTEVMPDLLTRYKLT